MTTQPTLLFDDQRRGIIIVADAGANGHAVYNISCDSSCISLSAIQMLALIRAFDAEPFAETRTLGSVRDHVIRALGRERVP